jgi:hypothetical protein
MIYHMLSFEGGCLLSTLTKKIKMRLNKCGQQKKNCGKKILKNL